MKFFDVATQVGKLFRARARRVSVGVRRAHVEFRDICDDELSSLAAALNGLTQGLEFCDWVEVNAHTRRVVFAYQDHAYGADVLVQMVTQAERIAQVANANFSSASGHPANVELGVRRLVELSADMAAFVVGLALTFSPVPAVPFSGNIVAVLSLVRGSPRLRRRLEERLGSERAEFFLSLANSVGQGVAQRPLSSFVDASHKFALLREFQAQRTVWRHREAELLANGSEIVGQDQAFTRPCPPPRGPIEEYADRAWVVSLSGFALSFLTTRSIQRATSALFGGLPRPARVGRDVFASELACRLAERGIVILDPDALRRLDRVDCLVIQGDLVSKDKFVLGGVLTEDPDEGVAARERIREMFDSERPLSTRVDGLWALKPLGQSDASRDIYLQQHATKRLEAGSLLLSLERAGRAVAVAEVEIVARTGVEELIAAAQEAQLRVVVAAPVETAIDRFNADDLIPSQEGLKAGIRRLQREGQTVAVVATGTSEGLALADIGIGLCRADEPTPWGADLICRSDLADVRYLIRASDMARRLSKQAVNIALGAASMGALTSAGGLLPLTTQRVLFVVNMASLLSMANGLRTAIELQRTALPEPRDPTPWHALDAQGVLTRLGSSIDGLSRSEVVRRVNHVPERSSALADLGSAISDEFFTPLAPLLALGAGLSAVVGSVADAAMVAGVVGLNATVGGVQKFRTNQKIAELSRTDRRMVRVRRTGEEFVVDARDLVQGDVVLLGPGDVVPADCRVIEAHSLEIDASSLTGESLPVRKGVAASFEAHIADRSSMLYDGTSLAAGRAVAVVVATGQGTEAQRGAGFVKRSRTQGGVEARLRALMDLTGPVALAAGVGVVGGGLLRGRKLSELVNSAVSLAVASVPEGLPVLATAAQLAAAQRLGLKGALVRNGRSIEALGRVDVICLDKTGTVTEGRICLNTVSDGDEHEAVPQVSRLRRDVLAAALRASPDRRAFANQDPTDAALLDGAESIGLGCEFGALGWQRHSELSFEAGRSYHATLGIQVGRRWLSIKGAPEVILPLCTNWRREGGLRDLDDDLRFSLSAQATSLARRGLRVLAVAECQRDDLLGAELQPGDLAEMSFLGFLAFTDPVRPTALMAIKGLSKAGVRTVMLTGDHPSTAEAVAMELGLLREGKVLSGAQLADMDDTNLDAFINEVAVFARVTPAQKVRVVRSLQRRGRVVAMVGDGANDAPAIRLADVGVAIGEHSTAAARGAADIVLTDGRLETLVTALAEGRAMWASVRDAVSILIGGNFGEIGFTTAIGLIAGRPPLNARQLLLVNLLTDVAPAMAIALRPPTQKQLEDLASAGPDASLGKILNRDIALRAVLTGVGAGTAWTIARVTGSGARARTVALAALVGTQLGQTLTSAQGSRAVYATGIGSAALLAAIIQTPGLSHFFGCRPIGPLAWATAIGSSAAATSLPALSHLLLDWFTDDPKPAVSAETGLADAKELTSGSVKLLDSLNS